ncbi:T9SS type A sorting domain-containing protein [Hymenobacter sp. 15J16-1T3B]|uniref:T9SS type A sorting domain-containing protein n=1 Tax=Hymenobacter sp. 15J16-1T3B TaxID=2886941 RepID=UPI001D11292F|nr:T9SS type A sorting domain-containing protein [Hymenobacter sp. 15J16-1T3B]MCC3156272.1 T9SS type A sorting domain-containing protein [Hymenobacter sp. 15J16-1T3B]
MHQHDYSSVSGRSKKAWARLSALAAAVLLAPAAWAQAPANDDCTGAVSLTPAATCVTTTGTITGATQSQAPIACAGFTSGSAKDVWYKFVATGTAHAVTFNSTFDGVLEGFSGACSSLASMGCADATVGGTETLNMTGLTVGSTYYVRYYPYAAATTVVTGALTACVTSVAAAPANDNPSGAITLPITATCTPVNGTNAGATTTTPSGYTNPGTSCGIAVNPKDVWYKVTTAASGAGSTSLRLTVTGNPAGYLRLFSATSATGPFTEITCSAGATNNTVAAPLTASGLTPNTTYYISVAGYGSADTQGAFTICATTIPDNDAEVQIIYALGKAPAGSAQTVQAVVRNVGGQTITGLPVTLAVSGGTTFSNSQLIGSLAPGASSTVTFTGFTVPATATGTNTLTVSLLADDNTANNSQVFTQNVTTNTFSYVNTATVIGANNSVGFGPTATAAFVVRYNTSVARSITSVVANIGDPGSVGNTVYGVVVSSTGTLLGRSANYVVTAADVNQRHTFTLNAPVAVAAGDFLVGLVQTPAVDGSTQYFPMSYVPQTPTRTGTFYTISPFSATAGGTLADAASQGFGIFVVEANADVTTGTSAALNRAVNLYPNPSTNGEVTLSVQGAKAQAGLEVQILNTLGQTVYTNAQLRDNFENKLNLSHLAAGVYTLKVKMGNDYTIRQLSLTK